MSDMVNHPAHYTAGSVECIDAIRSAVTDLQGFDAYCTGNAIKYLWRWKRKGGTQDLSKAVWYIQRLISTQEAGALSAISVDLSANSSVQTEKNERADSASRHPIEDIWDAYERVEALSKGVENG